MVVAVAVVDEVESIVSCFGFCRPQRAFDLLWTDIWLFCSFVFASVWAWVWVLGLGSGFVMVKSARRVRVQCETVACLPSSGQYTQLKDEDDSAVRPSNIDAS